MLDKYQMKVDMVLSIIIPTYGRINEVKTLLNSIELEKITFSYEILMVDQNEDAILKNIVAEFENKLPLSWHRVHFKSLSKARNYGIFHANGSVLCFPDDDAEFSCGTVSIALKYMKKKQADCVFGKCIDKISGKDSVIKFGNKDLKLNLQNFEHNCIESTIFIKRKVALKYLFDENMGVGCIFGSQEGYDVVYRMLCNGCSLYYSPEILFYHPQKISSRNTDKEIKRAFYYSCGFGYLCRKNNFAKKYLKRLFMLTAALPFIALVKKRYFKYYFVQWMGLKLGYKYL